MSKMNAEVAQKLTVGDGAANNKAKGKQDEELEEQQQGGEVKLVHDFVSSSLEPKKKIVKVTKLQDILDQLANKDHGDGKHVYFYNEGLVILSAINDDDQVRKYQDYYRLPLLERLKRAREELVREWEEWEAVSRE